MAWLRTDDGFVHHPKFEGWPVARRWAWLEVMHYCARYSTQGRIPNDLSLLPKSATESLLNHAEISGWIDRDSDGDRWIHDWQIYNPKDPTKAERQARWRANKGNNVDGDVDAEETDETSTESSTSRARLPSRPLTTSEAAATTPAAALLTQLAEDLDDLNVHGGLRMAALQDPERAAAIVAAAKAKATKNPAGFFRRVLESGDWPNTNGHKPKLTSYATIRRMISNGGMPDRYALDAEIAAHPDLTDDEQAELRVLVPADVAASPDDDIPF